MVACLTAGPAWAQLPQHRLQSVYPAGGQAGETVAVQVGGADLEQVDGLWFNHPAIRAFHVKGPEFRVAIPSGISAGLYDVRAVGPLGVSNPRTFVVGERPESRETEPNNTADKASPIVLNSVVNGRSDAQADVDWFAFEGKKDQHLFLDLAASRIDSRLEGIIRVQGPDGRELAVSRSDVAVDPMLDLTLPVDGRFGIEVRDVVYAGSPDHGYRLTIHNGPYLDAIGPTATAKVALLGRGLPDAEPTGLQIDHRPLGRLLLDLTPPGPSKLDDPVFAPWPAQMALRRGFEYRLRGTSGWSNPVFHPVADGPVTIEREPNDAEHAQDVELPIEIAGTFGVEGDIDAYRFHAKKGDVWMIEANAERIGSPADPAFVLQRLPEKGPAQDILNGDDRPDLVPGTLLGTSTTDTVARWQVPEDGAYRLVINDLYHSQRGDPRFNYRLQVRRERPDFRLFLVPPDPNALGGLTVRAGGRVAAVVLAARLDGFDRPILIEPLGLPDGVTCDPVIIGRGQTQAPIVFSARAGANPAVGPVTLKGRSLAADRKDVLDYTNGMGLDPELEHEALPGAPIWPSANLNGQVVAGPARISRGSVLAVRDGSPFQLTAEPAGRVAGPGDSVELNIKVDRHPDFQDAVKVAVADLSAKLEASPTVEIAKDKASASLTLKVAKDAPPGIYTFTLRGTGAFPFNKDPKAKEKPKVNVSEPSNLIRLTIHK